MPTSPSRLLPAALLTLVLAGGCGLPALDQAASAPAAASTADVAAWTDKFCGAIVTFQNASMKQPKIDQSSPKKALKGLRTYIDDFNAAVDTTVADLKAAGPSPVPAGDAAVTALTGYLNSVHASFAKAKAALAKANTNNPASIEKATAALSSLADPPDALENLTEDPALDAAAAESPNCKKLNATG